MSLERDYHSEQLKMDYVLDAIRLAQSFADTTRLLLKAGHLIEAARTQHHAEHFYSDARNMLWRLCEANASELVHQLDELRKKLDRLGRATRSVSA